VLRTDSDSLSSETAFFDPHVLPQARRKLIMDRNSGCRGLERLRVGLGLLVHRGEDEAAGEHSNHFEIGVFVTSYFLGQSYSGAYKPAIPFIG
jgi:hypothetical protein